MSTFMRVIATDLAGLLLIEPRCFRDDRGFFLESFQAERYRDNGIVDQFAQDNHSRAKACCAVYTSRSSVRKRRS